MLKPKPICVLRVGWFQCAMYSTCTDAHQWHCHDRDTAGQERFRTLTHAFYKQANGVVVTFDVTNEETFKNVRKWMESIFDHAD